MYILLAILLLAILITVHEFGHFLAARAMKIQVREFAIGMGPKLLGWKSRKYDTVFSIRAIPLGGYCAFYGEDDVKGASKDDPRAFPKQNVWKRMFVILMGPAMNFVLALAVATVFYFTSGLTVITRLDPYISEVAAGSPAAAAGIRAGDVVTEINGENMLDGTTDTLTETIAYWSGADGPLHMTILRGEETFETETVPVWDEEEKKLRIGVIIAAVPQIREMNPFEFCVYASGRLLEGLKKVVTTKRGLQKVSGPVGVISTVSASVKEGGFTEYMWLLVVLSVNLGLFNLLPVPGLDGSRLVFGLVEVIRGKAVPTEKEALIHLVGLVLLLGLMAVVTFQDISKLFQ